MITVVEKVWSGADLQALPEDGFIHEVVGGELIMGPKNNFQHGTIAARLFLALGTYAQEHRLGVVLDSSTGFWMQNQNCRAPDISFIRQERLAGWKPSTRAFFRGAPDVAVEILSPSNSRAEIDERLKDFFASGARLVWVINLDSQSVEVCHSVTHRALLGCGGFLEASDLLPGFRMAILDLFREWDWE